MILIMMVAVLITFFANTTISGQSSMESFFFQAEDGIRYFFKHPILLSAVSLDLFAVLFGGAVAMLPAFADTILHAGPEGLGYLRSAPAIGAVTMSLIMAFYPPHKGAGKKMLWCVAGFGLCMIGFVLSTSFVLSFAILLLSGMFDNVSVVIRSTILQTHTPDEMRGRVSAVNSIFVGSSNELEIFGGDLNITNGNLKKTTIGSTTYSPVVWYQFNETPTTTSTVDILSDSNISTTKYNMTINKYDTVSRRYPSVNVTGATSTQIATPVTFTLSSGASYGLGTYTFEYLFMHGGC